MWDSATIFLTQVPALSMETWDGRAGSSSGSRQLSRGFQSTSELLSLPGRGLRAVGEKQQLLSFSAAIKKLEVWFPSKASWVTGRSGPQCPGKFSSNRKCVHVFFFLNQNCWKTRWRHLDWISCRQWMVASYFCAAKRMEVTSWCFFDPRSSITSQC